MPAPKPVGLLYGQKSLALRSASVVTFCLSVSERLDDLLQGKDAHPSPPSHEAGDPHLLSSGRTLQGDSAVPFVFAISMIESPLPFPVHVGSSDLWQWSSKQALTSITSPAQQASYPCCHSCTLGRLLMQMHPKPQPTAAMYSCHSGWPALHTGATALVLQCRQMPDGVPIIQQGCSHVCPLAPALGRLLPQMRLKPQPTAAMCCPVEILVRSGDPEASRRCPGSASAKCVCSGAPACHLQRLTSAGLCLVDPGSPLPTTHDKRRP